MNPEAAKAIKRMVEAEQLLKKRRGPLHPSTEEEIMRAAEVTIRRYHLCRKHRSRCRESDGCLPCLCVVTNLAHTIVDCSICRQN